MLALRLVVHVNALSFNVLLIKNEWLVERLVAAGCRLTDNLRLVNTILALRVPIIVPHAPYCVVGVEEVLHAVRVLVGLHPHYR